MKQRKVPMRKDLLTNEMRPKKELVRIVRVDETTVAIDPTGKQAGRGAYVALDPEAVRGAAKKHLIESALSVKLDPDFYQELFDYVDHQKARQELFGAK